MKLKISLFAMIALIGLCSEAKSQWQNVAPNLLGKLEEYGAMTYKGGVVWAGLTTLYSSTDTGISWRQSQLGTPGHIYDIEFFDRANGIVATNTGAFVTNDQGVTWRGVGQPGLSYIAAGFGRTTSDIFLTQSSTATVNTSTDGGQSWTNYSFASFGAMTRILKDGSLATLGLHSGTGHAQISVSTDFGQSWNAQPGFTKFDCYNFVADPCEGNRIYVVNEEVYVQTDGFAQLFTSTDRGASWSAGVAHPVRYYNASMSITPDALYMGTCADGIQRTTDHGATWKGIGGPSAPPDTRDLIAIDDNIVLAADSNGSIFRTMNSGGSTVEPIGGSLAFLNPFVHATPATSCAEIDTFLLAAITSCANPIASLLDVSISGSINFSLLGSPDIGKNFTASEPIRVSYLGIGRKSDSAYLAIKYKIGSSIHDTTILLTAHGYAPRAASTFPQGTLQALPGDPVNVKISTNTMTQVASLNVKSITYRLTYNPKVIDMSSSMATSLVTPRPTWTIGNAIVTPGVLMVTENNVSGEKLIDSIYLGKAQFTALSSSIKTTTIYLDEVDLKVDTGTIRLCVGGEGDYLAHVTVPTNAVIATQSYLTDVRIYPVPASSGREMHLSINSANTESISVEIFDLLGRKISTLSSFSAQIGRNDFSVKSPEVAGTYYLRVSSSRGEAWAITRKLIVR